MTTAQKRPPGREAPEPAPEPAPAPAAPHGPGSAESSAAFEARCLSEARAALRRATRAPVRTLPSARGIVARSGPVSLVCRVLDEWAWVEARLTTLADDEVDVVTIAEASLRGQPTTDEWERAIRQARGDAVARLDRARAALCVLGGSEAPEPAPEPAPAPTAPREAEPASEPPRLASDGTVWVQTRGEFGGPR